MKYNNNNGTVPMRTHVNFGCLKLFVERKLVLIDFVDETYHN